MQREQQVREDLRGVAASAALAGALLLNPMQATAKTTVDAGHGGKDPGAVHGETYERDIVKQYAADLHSLLPGSEMSKVGDVKLPLYKRAANANEQKSDVFISFHANSSAKPVTTATGVRVLYNQNSPKGKQLAEELVAVLGGEIMSRGPADRGWIILSSTKMPAVIIELGFMNNPMDLKRMLDPGHRKAVVNKVAGVLRKLGYEPAK